MKKRLFAVTCFVKVFPLLFFSFKEFYIFVIKKLFYNVVHYSSEILSFLHGSDWAFNTCVEILFNKC